MKHIRFALALLSAPFLLTGCQPQEVEQTLVVYSAGPRPLIEEIVAAFEKQQGVQVDLFTATTGQVMAKLEAERYRNRADVVIFASELAAEALKKDGRLRAYRPDAIEQTFLDWHDADGYFHATAAAFVGIAVRRDRPIAELEHIDWSDVMQAPYAQRTVMPSPSLSGATGDFLVNFAQVQHNNIWADFIHARADGLDFAAANSQAIGGLTTGAYDAILGVVDYLVMRQLTSNDQLDMRYPASGAAMVRRPIAIMNETTQPALAQHFVDFYFSEPMQQAVAAQHLIPARLGIEYSPERQQAHEDWPVVMPFDRRAGLAQQNRLLRQFQLKVERAEIPSTNRP